jgi:putative transposase
VKNKRFTEEQILGFLKQAEGGVPVAELCRKGGFSDAAFYKWRRKYGGMELPEIRRVRELEAENAKLKRLLAETLLDAEALKIALGRKR